jgi:hypothetical protein
MSAATDLERGWTLRYDDAPVVFTHHAIERANHRAFRLLDDDLAATRLYKLAQRYGTISRQRPRWVLKQPRERARMWLVVDSPDLPMMAFPLMEDRTWRGGFIASSCVTPGQDQVGASVRWTGDAAKLQDLGRPIG